MQRESILARGDVEEYDGRARQAGRRRFAGAANCCPFRNSTATLKPLRAKPGEMTQLDYARAGISPRK